MQFTQSATGAALLYCLTDLYKSCLRDAFIEPAMATILMHIPARFASGGIGGFTDLFEKTGLTYPAASIAAAAVNGAVSAAARTVVLTPAAAEGTGQGKAVAIVHISCSAA